MKKKSRRKRGRRDLASENKRLLKRLKEASSRDPLTRLRSYEYFIDALDTKLKHARKYMFPLSVILLDMDYFKSINDTYGHRVGNKLLIQFAGYLKKFVRPTDIVARYIGAGFAILLSNTDKSHTLSLGHRLCENLQRHRFRTGKLNIKLKVSIGVVSFPEDGINGISGFTEALDMAARNAKDQGGNKVSTYETVAKKDKAVVSKKEEIEKLKD